MSSFTPKDKEDLRIFEENTVEVIKADPFQNWKQEPTVADLKQDLEDAKQAHDTHVNKVASWLDNLNVTGSAAIKKRPGRSSYVPKVIRKQAEWRYAALSEPFLSTEDLFNTSPVTFEDRTAARQNGLVLNSQFNHKIKKIQFIDEYIRAAVDEGTVICRLGWDFQEEEITTREPVYEFKLTNSLAIVQKFQQNHQLMTEAPEEFKKLTPADQELHEKGMEMGGAVERIRTGTKEITEMVVLKNDPTVEVCDYRNVTIDPSCQGDLDKAQFVIYSYESSLAELKAVGKFKNLDKIKVDTSSTLNEPDVAPNSKVDENFNFSDKARKRFVVKEYWGYRDVEGDGNLQAIVATWVGNVMIQMEENPFPDQKVPFVSAQYLPVRKEVYGEPDGELLIDNQKIVGAVTRGMLDMMGRSANSQVATMKGALDVVNRRKYERGQDYEYNPGIDPKSAFYMHQYPEIPRSAEYILNSTNADAESLTGVKAFHGGISGQALGDTATGIRSALDATSKRELGILRRLAQGIKDIGRKIISMNSEFLEDEEVVRITNDDFVVVRRDDLQGRLDLTLSISTAEADNEKAKELAFMLQTMGNNMDPQLSKMILSDIARLRKMPDMAQQIEAYQPKPDPMVVKQQELQIALLEAQVSNEYFKGLENKADIALKEAKTRDLNTKADLGDQSFLEKESGADKAFEMDKLNHKRGTDLDLKSLDSILDPDDEQTPATKV
jgi:hypothetical protein